MRVQTHISTALSARVQGKKSLLVYESLSCLKVTNLKQTTLALSGVEVNNEQRTTIWFKIKKTLNLKLETFQTQHPTLPSPALLIPF
jgi:hypothetical protein